MGRPLGFFAVEFVAFRTAFGFGAARHLNPTMRPFWSFGTGFVEKSGIGVAVVVLDAGGDSRATATGCLGKIAPLGVIIGRSTTRLAGNVSNDVS